MLTSPTPFQMFFLFHFLKKFLLTHRCIVWANGVMVNVLVVSVATVMYFLLASMTFMDSYIFVHFLAFDTVVWVSAMTSCKMPAFWAIYFYGKIDRVSLGTFLGYLSAQESMILHVGFRDQRLGRIVVILLLDEGRQCRQGTVTPRCWVVASVMSWLLTTSTNFQYPALCW